MYKKCTIPLHIYVNYSSITYMVEVINDHKVCSMERKTNLACQRKQF